MQKLISVVCYLSFVLVAVLVSAAPTIAAPAAPEALDELFRVTRVQQLVEGSMANLDRDVKQSGQQFVQGLQLSGEAARQAQSEVQAIQQQAINRVRRELSWQQMRPRFIDLYSRTFSAEEIAGMLAFYRTPAGVATIEKMPQLMGQLGQVSQQVTQPIVTQMIQEMQAVAAKYRGAGAR